ncbi:hypothetical protein QC764_0008060 [Podospora pseudoanserina]|uniref:Uncharacterized protein n=1 Tax=Podospora pseudoanserina TaxID=2609844 RepID=A0ABR0ILS8_9PEZI|nr:hypothetical protein QC764_0008060 [Podospora pseudoanserina]
MPVGREGGGGGGGGGKTTWNFGWDWDGYLGKDLTPHHNQRCDSTINTSGGADTTLGSLPVYYDGATGGLPGRLMEAMITPAKIWS